MRRIATCVAAVLAVACGADEAVDVPTGDGDGDSMSDGDGDVPAGDGDGDGDAQEPVCRTVSVQNAAAGEKINAAFCIGMAYTDAFACNFYPADDATECVGQSGTFIVWYDPSTRGEARDAVTDEYIAEVVQGATGAFEIVWADGTSGTCTVVGDVATLCVDAP